MIPVALALHRMNSQHSPGVNRTTVAAGVTALSLVVVGLLLEFVNVLGSGLYMVPQGLLGVWLIVVNRHLSAMLPRGIRWLGIVAGFGLVLVAAFPIGYAIFVDPRLGPIPFDYQPPKETEMANNILHNILGIGGLMGIPTYSIWATLVGRRLLRSGRP